MKGVLRAAAVRGGIGERLDDLQLLDDRAGPPVGDDQRQRVLMLGADVDEMNVEPVDFGQEIRQGVQLRESSATVSRSGHLVALTRLRRSLSSDSGNPTRNGRIAVFTPVACCPSSVMSMLLGVMCRLPPRSLVQSLVRARVGPGHCTGLHSRDA
jgi:hypothetical protein